ncbi:hypothetical protein OAY26_00705 [Acidimicrobiia bacterium]|jgi:hypothetical protein|nr:hypothetical protein [Acidimicrobiia bacterium]
MDITRKINAILNNIGKNISTKFNNINGKTSAVDVPQILFQQRTDRQNRALISWKTVYKNNLTLDQLDTFENGICVEFINNDFLDEEFSTNSVFQNLKERLGSDENVSSIISFRVEDGDPGANAARESFEKFKITNSSIDLKPILRKDKVSPYTKFPKKNVGKGNEKWTGNSYYEIKGGQQNSIESHSGYKNQYLFNPAIEYANEEVCKDILISLFYFFLHCHDINNYVKEDWGKVKKECISYLKSRNYDDKNLYEYCENHPSLNWDKGVLIDPIEVTRFNVEDFDIKYDHSNPLSVAICHNEPVNKNIIKFDEKNQYIVSAARPTNFFWGKQSSNMVQQSYSLEEYFIEEELRVNRRKKFRS